MTKCFSQGFKFWPPVCRNLDYWWKVVSCPLAKDMLSGCPYSHRLQFAQKVNQQNVQNITSPPFRIGPSASMQLPPEPIRSGSGSEPAMEF
jgi:hypothetical protein